MSLALHEPDIDPDDEPGADEPLPRHFDYTPEPPYIPEPTPEESDHYARMWWGGRLG